MSERFVEGKESFDNWNTFVAECNKRGVAKLGEIINTAWQRTK